MAEHIQALAGTALSDLSEALQNYAGERLPDNHVGQFLDDDGRTNTQHGIYGMSAWLFMTSQPQFARIQSIAALSHQCRSKLQTWIAEATEQTPEELLGNSASELYELRFVIPKTASAFEALSLDEAAVLEVRVLQQWLTSSQRPDGSWPFVNNHTKGHPLATTWVGRSLRRSQTFSGLQRAEDFLLSNLPPGTRPCERLFVLNALGSSKSPETRRWARHHIKNSARDLFSLLHPSSCLYLYAHTGMRLWRQVTHISRRFSNASPQERPTTGRYLYICKFLQVVADSQPLNLYPSLLRIISKVMSLYAFGIDIAWNTCVAGAALLGALALYRFGLNPAATCFLGVGIKALLDILKNVYDLRSRSDQ
jgi:hypothetical protein